ncbi:MAG TPA: sensor histidine kinase, partial [Burkholderiales bacterium]|nr:sensor histidine kinase [Burkholderiales bacterium]
ARELHDELGQILTVAKMRLGMAAAKDGQPAQELLHEAVRDIDNGIDAVRRMSLDLHPPQLQFGLEAAVSALLHRDIPEDGPCFELYSTLGELKLDRTSAITAFRVVQESLSNALRHAAAQQIDVRLSREDTWLHVVVRDDGAGFDAATAKRKALEGEATGLLGLRERCYSIGGELVVSSAPGAGCEIHAQLPLRHHEI